MSSWIVMFPADDEAEWEAGTDADHEAVWAVDQEFAQLLAERGGAITGGAGLGSSRSARTLRRGAGSDPVVTDGPYAETVEQLSGFFLVTCDDPDALVDAARVLTRAHPVVEVRPVDDD